MKAFDYCNPVFVKFGAGVRKQIGPTLRDSYQNVLLVCSQGPFHENGLYHFVKENLEENGIRVYEMHDVESNPKLFRIREGVEVCKENRIDCILALGSGSAIDCAKAISAASAMEVDPYDLYWGKRVKVTKTIDTVMVPTFAATGSEMNRSSVAVNEKTKEKYFFDANYAKYVFMDPEVTLTVPIKLTIWGVMDILSHTFEYYFNGDRDSEFQTNLSEAVILSVMRNTERLTADPQDINARGEIMWAAAMTWGTGLTWIGRGEADMACHGIEESFSAYFDTHHGACLGVLTPRWMEAVAPKRPDLFARFARNIMKVSEADDRKAAVEGVRKYKGWLKMIGAPNTYFDLAPLAFSDEELKRVAATACRVYHGGVGRMTRFQENEIVEMLKSGRDPY